MLPEHIKVDFADKILNHLSNLVKRKKLSELSFNNAMKVLTNLMTMLENPLNLDNDLQSDLLNDLIDNLAAGLNQDRFDAVSAIENTLNQFMTLNVLEQPNSSSQFPLVTSSSRVSPDVIADFPVRSAVMELENLKQELLKHFERKKSRALPQIKQLINDIDVLNIDPATKLDLLTELNTTLMREYHTLTKSIIGKPSHLTLVVVAYYNSNMDLFEGIASQSKEKLINVIQTKFGDNLSWREIDRLIKKINHETTISNLEKYQRLILLDAVLQAEYDRIIKSNSDSRVKLNLNNFSLKGVVETYLKEYPLNDRFNPIPLIQQSHAQRASRSNSPQHLSKKLPEPAKPAPVLRAFSPQSYEHLSTPRELGTLVESNHPTVEKIPPLPLAVMPPSFPPNVPLLHQKPDDASFQHQKYPRGLLGFTAEPILEVNLFKEIEDLKQALLGYFARKKSRALPQIEQLINDIDALNTNAATKLNLLTELNTTLRKEYDKNIKSGRDKPSYLTSVVVAYYNSHADLFEDIASQSKEKLINDIQTKFGDNLPWMEIDRLIKEINHKITISNLEKYQRLILLDAALQAKHDSIIHASPGEKLDLKKLERFFGDIVTTYRKEYPLNDRLNPTQLSQQVHEPKKSSSPKKLEQAPPLSKTLPEPAVSSTPQSLHHHRLMPAHRTTTNLGFEEIFPHLIQTSGKNNNCGASSIAIGFATLLLDGSLKRRKLLDTRVYRDFLNAAKRIDPKIKSFDDLAKKLRSFSEGHFSTHAQNYLAPIIREVTVKIISNSETYKEIFTNTIKIFFNVKQDDLAFTNIKVYRNELLSTLKDYGLSAEDQALLMRRLETKKPLSPAEIEELFRRSIVRLGDPENAVMYYGDILIHVAKQLGFTIYAYSKENPKPHTHEIINPVAILKVENQSNVHWEVQQLYKDQIHMNTSSYISREGSVSNPIARELISLGYPVLLARSIVNDVEIQQSLIQQFNLQSLTELNLTHYIDFMLTEPTETLNKLHEYKVNLIKTLVVPNPTNTTRITYDDINKQMMDAIANFMQNRRDHTAALDYIRQFDFSAIYETISSAVTPQQKLALIAAVKLNLLKIYGADDIDSLMSKLNNPDYYSHISETMQEVFEKLHPEIQQEIYEDSLDYNPKLRLKELKAHNITSKDETASSSLRPRRQ